MLGLQRLAGAQGRKALKISIGRIPWAADTSPMTPHMIENKQLEKRAAEFGYDLNIDWREMKLTNTEALAIGVKAGLELMMTVMKTTIAFIIHSTSPSPKRPARATTARASRSNWRATTCAWRWNGPRPTVSMRWSAVPHRSRSVVLEGWTMPIATPQR